MAVIPFYGIDRPDLFAIERAAMDRPGHVIRRLDRLLPAGVILDIGAGDGYSAELLANRRRRVIAVEPARGMIDTARNLAWVQADAEALPFADGSCDGAYATWAYFFTGGAWDPTAGIAELHRTVKEGGTLVVADNAGGDDLTALSPRPMWADVGFWRDQGFGTEIVDTVFEFETATDAWRLLDFYFDGIADAPPTTLSFRVGLFIGTSRGPER